MWAIQEDNANHNAVMPADLDEDGDIVEEFESLPRHTVCFHCLSGNLPPMIA